jgi:hypothetical protein
MAIDMSEMYSYLFGVLIGATVTGLMVTTYWRSGVIKRGFGGFDAKTGLFKWREPEK